MFPRKGTGGRVMVGYKRAARVQTWEYTPEPEHGEAKPGAGIVNVVLDEVDPVWLQGSEFTLELREKARTLRWETAEMLSDCCFIVPEAPTAVIHQSK